MMATGPSRASARPTTQTQAVSTAPGTTRVYTQVVLSLEILVQNI
jgi:hypothetical protein